MFSIRTTSLRRLLTPKAIPSLPLTSRLRLSGPASSPPHALRLSATRANPRAARTMASAAATSASPPPSIVTIDGHDYTEVQEGLGKILVPCPPQTAAPDDKANGQGKDNDAKTLEERQRVFYNPIQQFNRDLTVLAIKAYGEQSIASKTVRSTNRLKRKRDKADHDTAQGEPKKHAPDSDAAPAAASGDKDAANGPSEQPAPAQQPPLDPEVQGTAQPDAEGAPEEPANGRQPMPPRFTILDALSATGLRALRYAKELPFVTSVTANDLTASAVEAIKLNATHNGVQDKVVASQGDARVHMYNLISEEIEREHESENHRHRRNNTKPSKKYDVIDLDPYGTAATFFDSAIHAVRDDGGLLCVTCTDSAVFASHGYSEKTFALYGGIPVKGWHSHEAGLRLVLHALATTAARHGLAIEPQLSLSIDYYCRVFVKVRKSPAKVKYLAGKTMMVYSCDQGCGAYETQLLLRNRKAMNKSGKGAFYKHTLSMGPTVDKTCDHCHSKMHVAGPMYAGPLHAGEFIKRILDSLPNAPKEVYGTLSRIEGMLQTALEETIEPPAPTHEMPETPEDALAAVEPYPFYFHPTVLAGSIRTVCPDQDSLRGALRGLGYQVTRSHCKPGSIKTNAPWSVIWHVMREWVRQKHPNVDKKIQEGSVPYALLRLGDKATNAAGATEGASEVDKLEVVFDKVLGKETGKKAGLVRYPANPTSFWGPQTRASG